ncbi:hypothetical protein [Hymenobacter amundsenii]|nr:hypothetical protein [Hymenobacter amundsenii]
MLLLLAAAALTAASASAQTTTPMQRPANGQMQQATPEQQADRLTKQLGLSADQRTQLVTMEQARRTEMQAMHGQQPTEGDRAAMRQNMQTMRTKYDTQLKGILTADQYAKYEQQRENRMENRGNRKMKMKVKS